MTGKEERLTVTLSGGGPWGFRLQGGAGTGLPLIVSKVRRKSRAHRRLREGDRILCVNGRSADFLTYDQVMEIADGSGTDLTLEVLRKECDKENLAPTTPHVPAKHVKEVDSGCFTKENVSLTESSTKVSEEKEFPKMQSETQLPKDTTFEDFTDREMTELPAETKETAAPVQSFAPFSDLQREGHAPTGEIRNFVETTMESRQEIKDGKETSFFKEEHDIKSIDNVHGVPDITLDTIDLNNLISATQKKLESFKNGFKQESLLTSGGLGEVKRTEVSTLTSETLTSETKLSQTETSETRTFESTHLTSDSSLRGESVDSVQHTTSVESKQDAAKREPPPKPKTRADPCFDLFKDVLSEMDPGGTPGDLGFAHSADESSSVVTETTPFGTTLITKKKKMFSSSSFYEEPQSIYPTVEEQVEMARKIADSLADDTNKKSKGANMFYKRVKRSSKWIHEGPEPSDESAPGTPEVRGVEPPTPDPSQVPFRPSKGPPKLKLILDPRHPLDLSALRSSGFIISEHNVVSPEVCHDLVKDLHSPVGKGAALFAKRKKKSEEWVVDEEKVKALLREQEKRSMAVSTPSTDSRFPGYSRPEVKLVKTPWEAAMENPYGFCDAAFARVSPDQLADTVIRAADSKRGSSLSRESSRMEGCLSPLPSYDIYHGKAPKGWLGNPTAAGDLSQTAPIPSVPPPVSSHQPTASPAIQNGFPSSQKRVFQNFNAVPRLWKGASVH